MSLYVPDALEDVLRKRASAKKMSVSAYVGELIRREVAPAEWPQAFLETFGAWRGTFEEPTDPPPSDDAELRLP